MLNPTAKEQKLLDQIEELSQTGKLHRSRSGESLDASERDRRHALQSKAFEGLVHDLTSKTPRGEGNDDYNPQHQQQQQQDNKGGAGRRHSSAFLLGALSSGGSGARGNSAIFAAAASINDQDDLEAPFEQLVTAFEASSSHLPANLARCFQESVGPGAGSLAQLVEQWVATEGPSGGGGGGGSSPPPPPPPAPVSVVVDAAAAATPASRTSGGGGGAVSKRRSSAVSLIESSDDHHQHGLSSSPSPSSSVIGVVDQQQHHGASPTPAAATPARSRRGAGAGLSTAAKARLRSLLEQGITDFTTRLQASILTEIEVVNNTSSHVVARGGVLAQQHKIDVQELAVAKKEIQRIHDLAVEQAARMKQLEEESSLRESQFDILRNQLVTREDMLREATATFRKELNRFRGRISDLEAELERRRHSGAPVVASWGHHSSRSSTATGGIDTSTAIGRASPQAMMSMMSTIGGARSSGATQEREPDARGVLAAASAMDTLPTLNSDFSMGNTAHGPTPDKFADFSFASPQAALGGVSEGGETGGGGGDGTSSLQRRSATPLPVLGVTPLVQVASRTGMQEAVQEVQKEFDKKLFAVKQRAVADKRQAISALKTQQDLTIKSLRRDVEQREQEIAKLKEQLMSEQVKRSIDEARNNKASKS